MSFIPFEKRFEELLETIIKDPPLHARWINTLSYLENCGARKIARSEDPCHVSVEVLKHAAEEFRHAYYLKRQIARVTPDPLKSYGKEYLLGGRASERYLNALDLGICRYLTSFLTEKRRIKEWAYYLVTYAIEKRAFEMYPLYHRLLKEARSTVTVASIWFEEEEHLREMENQLKKIPEGEKHKSIALRLEAELCDHWMGAMEREIYSLRRAEPFGWATKVCP
jgi:hypothetical protein